MEPFLHSPVFNHGVYTDNFTFSFYLSVYYTFKKSKKFHTFIYCYVYPMSSFKISHARGTGYLFITQKLNINFAWPVKI
jgi:hypothetical protein